MTPEQFTALAALAKMQDSPSREAARLVLCNGSSVTDAAASVGISQPGANQAVLRMRRALALAERAVTVAVTM